VGLKKMLHMRNYFKKLLNKNIGDLLIPFYKQAGAGDATWISIGVNKNTIAKSILTKELEILTGRDVLSLKIAETKDGFFHQLWKNQKKLGSALVPSTLVRSIDFNQLINNLVEQKILAYQQKLNELDLKNFSPLEISQEDTALAWIRGSFRLLEKAIIQSLTDSELLFQTLFFMGQNPKMSHEEIRLITFNMDIKFEFLSNGLLRVHIYNDKEGVTGSSKKAALEGDFNLRKREMFDELTALISAISSGIKLT
jgi:hypothetical protein